MCLIFIVIQSAMRLVQNRLENISHNMNLMKSQYPEERHLTCAMLAWQQLGHHDTDSLYQYVFIIYMYRIRKKIHL